MVYPIPVKVCVFGIHDQRVRRHEISANNSKLLSHQLTQQQWATRTFQQNVRHVAYVTRPVHPT